MVYCSEASLIEKHAKVSGGGVAGGEVQVNTYVFFKLTIVQVVLLSHREDSEG